MDFIKSCYKTLACIAHPDKPRGSSEAFQSLTHLRDSAEKGEAAKTTLAASIGECQSLKAELAASKTICQEQLRFTQVALNAEKATSHTLQQQLTWEAYKSLQHVQVEQNSQWCKQDLARKLHVSTTQQALQKVQLDASMALNARLGTELSAANHSLSQERAPAQGRKRSRSNSSGQREMEKKMRTQNEEEKAKLQTREAELDARTRAENTRAWSIAATQADQEAQLQTRAAELDERTAELDERTRVQNTVTALFTKEVELEQAETAMSEAQVATLAAAKYFQNRQAEDANRWEKQMAELHTRRLEIESQQAAWRLSHENEARQVAKQGMTNNQKEEELEAMRSVQRTRNGHLQRHEAALRIRYTQVQGRESACAALVDDHTVMALDVKYLKKQKVVLEQEIERKIHLHDSVASDLRCLQMQQAVSL